ncbi:cuticular protein 47Eg-like isoform X1 [Nilaparvata lugens]|uniref:cuticular protein 47Eg-like isoform X1 n=1 Tax=Nilaparvata lugens TaxID=108931 RepID=UPI00193D509F|nr:cuticular protein 47Eg-like isoform X1 [Nilaparvata lugens]
MLRCTILNVALSSLLILQCQSQFQTDGTSATILYYTNEVNVDSYRFEYRTSDDTVREESGGFENGVWTVRGSVTWTPFPGGPVFRQFYTAGANGYQITLPGSGAPGIFFPPPAFDSVPAAVPVFKGVDSYRGLVGGALISPNWKPPKPKQPERSK